MKYRKWDHHKPLLVYLRPIMGFYIPEMSLNIKTLKNIDLKIPNKGYRNLGYFINSILLNSSQSFVDTGGSDKGILQFRGGYSHSNTPYNAIIMDFGRYGLSYGSSSNPHDITKYDLYSRHSSLSFMDGFAWMVKETNKTIFMHYCRYMFPPPSVSVGEVGLYIDLCAGTVSQAYGHFLLARAIIDPSVIKEYNTLYEEGWVIEFPSNYTRVLAGILSYCSYFGHPSKFDVKDINNNINRVRTGQPSGGNNDLMIGGDNTSPSPDDHKLVSPIGSLSSQSQSVELDTMLQEVRIVRQGTYTPSTNITVGEIGWFMDLYDDTNTAHKTMVARAIWDPPIILYANTTYTLGMVMRLG